MPGLRVERAMPDFARRKSWLSKNIGGSPPQGQKMSFKVPEHLQSTCDAIVGAFRSGVFDPAGIAARSFFGLHPQEQCQDCWDYHCKPAPCVDLREHGPEHPCECEKETDCPLTCGTHS